MKLARSAGHSMRMMLQALLSPGSAALDVGGDTDASDDSGKFQSVGHTRDAVPITVDALFRRHFDDVYRVVGRMLGPMASRLDVEDLTQQVFLTAHRAWPRFRGDSQPGTWLYGIAVRVVLTDRRARRRRSRLFSALTAEPQPSPRINELEAHVAQRQQLERVWHCLMRIPPKKRAVYLLYEIEKKSGAEIASALDIPLATVWTRLHHARAELVRELRRAGLEDCP